MSVFHLTGARGASVCRALASIETATLVRSGADAYLDVAPEAAAVTLRDLAFVGIAAKRTTVDLAPPRHLAVGIGKDLVPLAAELAAFDVLRVERVDLGAATAEVLRRRLAGIVPPGREARDRCRALLRGECVMFRWGRRVWATRKALRSRSARSSVHPVVFDRSSLDRWELEGRTCTHDDALARWAFS